MLYQEEIPAWIPDVFEPTLWWITAFLILFLGIFIYTRVKKQEAGKQFMSGLIVFGLFFGAARIIENLRKYYIAASRTTIIDGWTHHAPLISGVDLYLRIAYYVISWIGIATFYFYTEKYVFQQKYIFTTASILEATVSILMYFDFGDVARYTLLVLATIGFVVAAIAPVLMYIRMALINPGVLGKTSAMAAVGLGLFAFGVMVDLPQTALVIHLVEIIPANPWYFTLLAPVSAIAGAVILVIAYTKMFKDLY